MSDRKDYLDFNGPGIGSLEICFGGPRTATLRFAPELPQESRSEAAQEPSTIDHPTTPGEGNPFLQAAIRFKKGLRKRGQLI